MWVLAQSVEALRGSISLTVGIAVVEAVDCAPHGRGSCSREGRQQAEGKCELVCREVAAGSRAGVKYESVVVVGSSGRQSGAGSSKLAAGQLTGAALHADFGAPCVA